MDLTKDAITEIERLAKLGADYTAITLTDPRKDGRSLVETVPAYFNREDGEPAGVKAILDEWRVGPDFVKGQAKALTLDSFIALVNHHKTDKTALFYAIGQEGTPASMTAVIDYHGKNGSAPSHMRHKVNYPFPLSAEFKAWRSATGSMMKVSEFAEFLDDRIADLAMPEEWEVKEYGDLFQSTFANPASMMQLSRGLKIRVDSVISETRILQSGEGEIVWQEEHKDANGKKLIVPGLFCIAIPVFEGGLRERFICRLRYRTFSGSISWVFTIFDLDNRFRQIVEAEATAAANGTELPLFRGHPEA